MEFFVEIANGFQPLTNVPASSVLELQYVPDPPQDAQGLVKRLIIFLQALFSKKKVSATVSIYFIYIILFVYSIDITIICLFIVRYNFICLLLPFLRINK